MKKMIHIPLILSWLIGLLLPITALALEIPRIQPEELKRMIESGDVSFTKKIPSTQPDNSWKTGNIRILRFSGGVGPIGGNWVIR
jgi:hypothetical protein